MSISEYIASFDFRYRKIEKLKITLQSEILAFKRANISKEEKMLVLTGIDQTKKHYMMRPNSCSKSLKEISMT